MLYYHINNDFSKVQGINNNYDSFVMGHFYELINNNKD